MKCMGNVPTAFSILPSLHLAHPDGEMSAPQLLQKTVVTLDEIIYLSQMNKTPQQSYSAFSTVTRNGLSSVLAFYNRHQQTL